MNQSKINNFLFQNITSIRGVGVKMKKLLKKKKIEKISDLILNIPRGFTDRTNLNTLDKLVYPLCFFSLSLFSPY